MNELPVQRKIVVGFSFEIALKASNNNKIKLEVLFNINEEK